MCAFQQPPSSPNDCFAEDVLCNREIIQTTMLSRTCHTTWGTRSQASNSQTQLPWATQQTTPVLRRIFFKVWAACGQRSLVVWPLAHLSVRRFHTNLKQHKDFKIFKQFTCNKCCRVVAYVSVVSWHVVESLAFGRMSHHWAFIYMVKMKFLSSTQPTKQPTHQPTLRLHRTW